MTIRPIELRCPPRPGFALRGMQYDHDGYQQGMIEYHLEADRVTDADFGTTWRVREDGHYVPFDGGWSIDPGHKG